MGVVHTIELSTGIADQEVDLKEIGALSCIYFQTTASQEFNVDITMAAETPISSEHRVVRIFRANGLTHGGAQVGFPCAARMLKFNWNNSTGLKGRILFLDDVIRPFGSVMSWGASGTVADNDVLTIASAQSLGIATKFWVQGFGNALGIGRLLLSDKAGTGRPVSTAKMLVRKESGFLAGPFPVPDTVDFWMRNFSGGSDSFIGAIFVDLG